MLHLHYAILSFWTVPKILVPIFSLLFNFQARRLLLDPAIHEEFIRLKVCYSILFWLLLNHVSFFTHLEVGINCHNNSRCTGKSSLQFYQPRDIVKKHLVISYDNQYLCFFHSGSSIPCSPWSLIKRFYYFGHTKWNETNSFETKKWRAECFLSSSSLIMWYSDEEDNF